MRSALHADLVLKGATVLTVDANDSTAQAVAVKHGRIVGVLARADAAALNEAREALALVAQRRFSRREYR
jgi:predicted amidohydrolase YtcJ